MLSSKYRTVLASPAARRMYLMVLLIRTPFFAAIVALTLHTVNTLGRSYTEAGLITTVSTAAVAVASPILGRLIDRHGLRPVLGVTIVAQALVWSIGPWLGYWYLLGMALVGGLFTIPHFTILRQGLIAAVPDESRRTAISLDSLVTEITFMIGPAAGVWLAVAWDTRYALMSIMGVMLSGAVALWFMNPPMKHADAQAPSEVDRADRRSLRSVAMVTTLVSGVGAAIVLTGTDLATVAALRSTGHQSFIGLALAIWAAGSLIGAIVYGALHRSVDAALLLIALAIVTAPVAVAGGKWSLSAMLFVCGLLCAPTIAATIEQVSRAVPPHLGGEAQGWHGSAMTVGSAVGAPVTGFAIDHGGWETGVLVVAAIGLVLGVAALLTSKFAGPQRYQVAT